VIDGGAKHVHGSSLGPARRHRLAAHAHHRGAQDDGAAKGETVGVLEDRFA
jgi:hypothetical protein